MSKRSFSETFEDNYEEEEALVMGELQKWKKKLDVIKKTQKERDTSKKVNDLPLQMSSAFNQEILPVLPVKSYSSWFEEEEESEDQEVDGFLENKVEEITIEIEDEGPSSGSNHIANEVLEGQNMDAVPSTSNLDPQVEALLGKEGLIEEKAENNLHASIANKWSFILLKGLSSEIKENLLAKYTVPSNCLAMAAPVLNSEIKSNLKKDALDRDEKQKSSPVQLATILSAIGQALTKLLNAGSVLKTDIFKLIEILSDAGRLVADLHHAKSLHRRWLVLGIGFQQKIKNNVKDVLIN